MFEYLDKVYINYTYFKTYVVMGTNDPSHLNTLIPPTGSVSDAFWVNSRNLTLVEG